MQRADYGVPGRVWDRIYIGHTCWIWTGGSVNNSGYAHASVDGRIWGIHRLIFEAIVGPIPAGMHLDHLCRNRLCCNPAHLEAVTPRENLMRGETLTASRAAQTHCQRGHEFTPENTFVKPNGNRLCRECVRAANRRSWARRADAINARRRAARHI